MNKSMLDQRSSHLLKVLIDRYLSDGLPVGSRTLSKESGLELSPATIRNVVSDLEELGLVQSPHTSAGRIPTEHGLRLFVDTMLRIEPVADKRVKELQKKLIPGQETRELMASASNLLSDLTQLAGVVTLPSTSQQKLRQIEFLPLSDKRILAILVVSDQDVQNRILHTDRDYSMDELVKVGNYLTRLFAGQGIEDVRKSILEEMKAARETMDRLMMDAIQIADKTFSHSDKKDYVMAGQNNLMGVSELSDTRKLRQIFDAFNEKKQMLNLLDGAINAEGIQIFIGEESGYQLLDECSVITAPYQVDGSMVGVLGVIGPTRMAYDRVIPIVDLTAKLLGSALKQKL